MKNFILVGLIISVFFAVVWTLGYRDIFNLGDLDRKLWIITANLKTLLAVAFYIAWRVTPSEK